MICCSFAPWCPACKSVKPTWESFATQWSEDLDISVATVNINENPGRLFDSLNIFQLCHPLHLFTNKICETFSNFASLFNVHVVYLFVSLFYIKIKSLCYSLGLSGQFLVFQLPTIYQ